VAAFVSTRANEQSTKSGLGSENIEQDSGVDCDSHAVSAQRPRISSMNPSTSSGLLRQKTNPTSQTACALGCIGLPPQHEQSLLLHELDFGSGGETVLLSQSFRYCDLSALTHNHTVIMNSYARHVNTSPSQGGELRA
jgi:hypothetical protein